MSKKKLLAITLLLFITGCTTGNHGTFVPSTYIEKHDTDKYSLAGPVIGQSKQTWFLYIFPMGEAPSTEAAIIDAKSQIEGTQFLTDVSIDDTNNWNFGFSEQVVTVRANAYK